METFIKLIQLIQDEDIDFKKRLEIANEVGIANYDSVDKGNLTARQNGYVGGYMTKKLVEMAEQQLAGK